MAKIGIDARPLQTGHRFRGIGMYTRRLIEALMALAPEDTFVLAVYADAPLPNLDLAGANWEYRFVPGGPPNGIRAELRRALEPRLRMQCGDLAVFLQTAVEFGVPMGCKRYCTAYDLVPLLFRDHYYPLRLPRSPLKAAAWFRKVLAYGIYRLHLRSYSRFDGLVAISESTKRDFTRRLRFDGPVTVIPLGVASSVPASAVSPSSRIAKPFVLYVGADDFRKNVDALLATFARTRPDYEYQLVLAGKGWTPARLGPELEDVRGEIILLDYVDDHALTWLYRHALAFVLPSLYEGFGLPVLEAMQHGCPVIAYDNSSIAEVEGDAGFLVRDGDALDPAIIRLLTDPAAREALARRGVERVAGYSWQRTAAMTLQVLKHR